MANTDFIPVTFPTVSTIGEPSGKSGYFGVEYSSTTSPVVMVESIGEISGIKSTPCELQAGLEGHFVTENSVLSLYKDSLLRLLPDSSGY